MGEKLLKLTVEYADSIEARSYPGESPAGREPSEIAADYEAAIKELLAS
jgi:hypothetical protein